jgi:hypothetical protein
MGSMNLPGWPKDGHHATSPVSSEEDRVPGESQQEGKSHTSGAGLRDKPRSLETPGSSHSPSHALHSTGDLVNTQGKQTAVG